MLYEVITGGVSATFLWDYFLKKFPEVDYTVMGEGEDRITSYNVCYTKLLRNLREAGPCG